MNRKKIEIIIAVLILIALIVLVVFLLTRKKPEDATPTPDDTNITDELPPIEPEDVPPPQAVSAQTISRIFVERFGSYSSESDFQNITDVLSLATPAFQSQLQTLAATQKPSEEYYGVSTFVISNKITAETETTMTLMVTTQRREAIGTPGNSSTRYQDIEVRLEKVGEDWLISGYTWQN